MAAAPSPGFFEKLFGLSSYHGGGGSTGGYYNGVDYNSDYRSSPYGGGGGGGGSSGRRQKQGRSYSDICRVVTIDAYARPGGRVYPAAPFCPYGKI